MRSFCSCKLASLQKPDSAAIRHGQLEKVPFESGGLSGSTQPVAKLPDSPCVAIYQNPLNPILIIEAPI